MLWEKKALNFSSLAHHQEQLDQALSIKFLHQLKPGSFLLCFNDSYAKLQRIHKFFCILFSGLSQIK